VQKFVLAVVSMGTGSAVDEHILCAIWCLGRSFKRLFGSDWATGGVWLSRFSAVYGGLGAVLASGVDEPDGVLVFDGVPTGRRLAVGGVLEPGDMTPFVDYARRAVVGECAMLITHSEVFPTFGSKT